jgi:phage repressor protein C with HTH and peptisase S24 domain
MIQFPKDRLLLKRKQLGFKSAAAFAAAHAERGVVETTYRSWENGTRDLTMEGAKLLAPLLGTSWTWLLDGGPEPEPTPAAVNIQPSVRLRPATIAKPSSAGLSRSKIKVLGMVECGPDGWALWNGDTVDWIDRPANLIGVPDAYAVYIVGDSMEPRYFQGEVAHVNPHKPLTIGAFVVMQMVPPQDGGAPRAFLKRLIKRSGNKFVFEQYNPHKTFNLTREQIHSMHRVVGAGDP